MRNEKNETISNAGQTQQRPRAKKKDDKWKIIVIATVQVLLISSLIGVSVALGYTREKLAFQQMMYSRGMESNYSRAYYDLLDGANDMDVKLRKLSVSCCGEKQQSLLYEVWGSAALAENNLNAFESSDEGLKKAQKFVNQLGDYSHYLALKLSDGTTLSPEETATLSKLADMVSVFKRSLENVQKSLDDGRLFMSDNGILGDFAGSFQEFVSPSLEYPEMIYDGPFSDALDNRQPKGLKGENISQEQGSSIISEIFKSSNIKDIDYAGETTGDIETLNYTFTLNGGGAFAQISKKGGLLITFNIAKDVSETNAGAGESAATAIAFAEKLGYKNLELVWASTANGMTYVNLAPVENGTIIYPDIIKVKFDEASGEIIGFDALHYAFNHTERTVESPLLTEAEARSRISLENVNKGRLALIPLQETKELLTYEFECDKNGTYFVYIDAQTGKEANILYVIDTPQGTVLQ